MNRTFVTYFVHTQLSFLLRASPVVLKSLKLSFSHGPAFLLGRLDLVSDLTVELIEEAVGSGRLFAFDCL